MTPLLNRVAKKYPDLPRDAALQKIGRENAVHYATHQPLDFAWMIAGKMWHMWHGSGAAGRSLLGNIFQFMALALAIAGLVLLALRRRWEVVSCSPSCWGSRCSAGSCWPARGAT